MNTPSIEELKTLKGEIKENRKLIKPADYTEQKFGGESEYTIKSILSGLDGLMIDISTLVKAPVRFVKISTHDERTKLVNVMRNIRDDTNTKNITNLANRIEILKPLVARYGVRHESERLVEFDAAIDELQRKATTMSNKLSELSEIKAKGDSTNQEIEEIFSTLLEKADLLKELESSLTDLIAQNQTKQSDASEQLTLDKERSENIEGLLTESRSHKDAIEAFSKRVSQRETQLEDQETKTENYSNKIKEWENQRTELLSEANSLIESAKTALEYKTAEGLSAAFSAKYDEAKTDNAQTNWIKGALSFLLAAVAIGIWIFLDDDAKIASVFGRLSLIPILIGGAWFCAGQYVKLKNIAEDYAYKTVLAKSIVGFSEQPSDTSNKGEDYSLFVKSILEEMHNDPLRNRRSESKKHDISDLGKYLENSSMLKKILNKVDNLGSKDV